MADRLLWEDLEERPNPRMHPTALSALTYRRAHALSANLVAKALSRSRAAGDANRSAGARDARAH